MKQVSGEEFLQEVEDYCKVKTTEITFKVPLNGGDNYRMNECVDQYFDTAIDDLTRINDLVDQEIVASWRRERDNQVEINGGSK